MRGKTQIKFNIWSYIDINDINELVDEAIIKKKHFAVDISYNCVSITDDGEVIVDVDYENIKFEVKQ